MTFGFMSLSAGIPLIPLVIGIFALPEILLAVESRAPRFVSQFIGYSNTGEKLRWKEFKSSIKTILRSTGIGTGIGIFIPTIPTLI